MRSSVPVPWSRATSTRMRWSLEILPDALVGCVNVVCNSRMPEGSSHVMSVNGAIAKVVMGWRKNGKLAATRCRSSRGS